MDAVHLASSRQVHLSFNGVIVDIGTHATRQFLCPPIEIRFATLVAAAQPIFDCPPQAFPDGKLHHRRLPSPVPHRGKLRVHEFIDQDPLDWSLRTEFLNDRFTHAAVDRNLLGIYYRLHRPWRASQPTRRAKNFAGSFFFGPMSLMGTDCVAWLSVTARRPRLSTGAGIPGFQVRRRAALVRRGRWRAGSAFRSAVSSSAESLRAEHQGRWLRSRAFARSLARSPRR